MENAMEQQKRLADEKLRWQISIGLILAFIALEIFGSAAIGLKSWWHDFTWKWQNEHSSSSKPPDTNTGSDTNTGTSTDTYIPPYYRTPDTLSSAAAHLAATVTEDSDMQTLGVNAISSHRHSPKAS
jgi:hypothetical protein